MMTPHLFSVMGRPVSLRACAFAVCLLAFLPATKPALADGGVDDGGTVLQRLLQQGDADSPAAADDSIRLTPDETKVIRLDRNAATVIVTNPAHAAAALDTPQLLVILPRAPGTTLITVLDAAGEVILRKNLIVSSTARENYVRIRRACPDGGSDCNPANYYYCPDGCYEVQTVPPAATMNVPTVNPAYSAAPPPPGNAYLPPEAPETAGEE